MAYEAGLFDITAKSSGDMSSNQYKLVSLSSSNDTGGCIVGPTTLGGRITGIWQEDSTAAEYGKIRVLGISKAVVSTGSGPIVGGSLLTGSTATHGGVTLSTSTGMTQFVVGIAMAAIASGSSGVIPVLLTPSHHLSNS